MHLTPRRNRSVSLLLPALLAMALGASSCRKSGSDSEQPYRMQPAVRMSDPRAQMQLVNGFYGVEGGAWRWTKQRFSALLSPPAGAAQKGATLQLRLMIPEVVISKLRSVTLTGSVNGQALAPETYDRAGNYAYTRDIPAGQMTGDTVKVDFELDKAMAPNPPDLRELGIVVMSIALNTK